MAIKGHTKWVTEWWVVFYVQEHIFVVGGGCVDLNFMEVTKLMGQNLEAISMEALAEIRGAYETIEINP